MGATASAALQTHLLQRLAAARARTDDLFDVVRPEALYDRPIPERHRIAFYLGHLEAFDWNLLRDALGGLAPFEPSLDRLFAFGIDPVDGGLPNDQPSDWPAREQIAAYNQRVRNAVDHRLAASFDPVSEQPRDLARLLHVAVEHRLMHAETLTYMLHQLPSNRKLRAAGSAPPVASPAAPRMVEIPAGTATLGMPRAENGPFGWDNEFEQQSLEVPAFRIDAYQVTNGEFQRFVEIGGYGERSLWNDSDWDWIQSSGTSHPAFWEAGNEGWSYRGMFGDVPLPLDWPVYVSYAEAAAYARWVGKKLPSEAEWHRAAYGAPDASERERSYPWGEQAPDASRGNFDFARWDPTQVGLFPAGNSAFGVADLLGNGWEWTRTPFAPFPGFEPFPFYPGYSANFFDGRHYVMKGGSSRTDACMLRRSFRNWFQPHYPFVYAGFRCVER